MDLSRGWPLARIGRVERRVAIAISPRHQVAHGWIVQSLGGVGVDVAGTEDQRRGCGVRCAELRVDDALGRALLLDGVGHQHGAATQHAETNARNVAWFY